MDNPPECIIFGLPATPTPTIFISHIHAEQSVARVLRDYLIEAFESQVNVFVSSDGISISGGEDWFNKTVNTLRKSDVVLVLVSRESSSRPWINFEAGMGAASENRLVLPIAICDFTFDRLSPPLQAFTGRLIIDIEGIVYDISRNINLTSRTEGANSFREDIRKAEAKVIHRSIALRPRIISETLTFEIENQGNVDIDLLHVVVKCPRSLVDRDRRFGRRSTSLSGILMTEKTIEISGRSEEYHCIRYTALSDAIFRLEPVLTPSMKVVQLNEIRIPIQPEQLSKPDPSAIIFYQVHARNYRSEEEHRRWPDIVFNNPLPPRRP